MLPLLSTAAALVAAACAEPDKSQMQNMVQRLLRLKEIPKPDDAADALAIALCHLNSASLAAAVPA
jgi:Holliday junction resolvasome RuvABC endonuclease subunit